MCRCASRRRTPPCRAQPEPRLNPVADLLANPQQKSTGFSHEKIETNNFLMIVLILLVVAVGGIVEIVPLFFQRSTTEAAPGLKP